MDNGPCHWLDDAGKAWLAANNHRFYATTTERDTALTAVFSGFQSDPTRIAGHVRRYRPGATAD